MSFNTEVGARCPNDDLWACVTRKGRRASGAGRSCEILAELRRLGGTPFAPAKGACTGGATLSGASAARFSEDISLDELAAIGSRPFISRMFTERGMPPRAH